MPHYQQCWKATAAASGCGWRGVPRFFIGLSAVNQGHCHKNRAGSVGQAGIGLRHEPSIMTVGGCASS